MKFHIKNLCRMAIFIAMYVLLSTLSIRAGTLKITFASLSVVVCSMLFGPLQGAAVAIGGEFFVQLLFYGLMPTTFLWIFPPAARALVIGLAASIFRRSGRQLERRPGACYVVCAMGAVVTTLSNTAMIYLDSMIYGYYSFAYVFGNLILRLITGMVTALIITTLSIPLIHLLGRSNIAAARSG